MSNLTPKQRLGLARDKNIALNAGAGTGKTRILVERYLAILIEEDLDIKNVLAITFTNKAAAEVMARVAQDIEEKLLVTKKEGIRRKLLNIRNRLSSANISTIHAFCMRILRDYPLESGLDPEFNLLNELQSNLMIEGTIKEEIGILNKEEINWLDLFRIFGQRTINEMLQFGLDHRFEMEHINRYGNEDSIGDQYNNLINRYLDHKQATLNQDHLCELENLISNFPIPDKKYPKAIPVINALNEFKKNIKVRDLSYWHSFLVLTGKLTTSQEKAYKNLNVFGGKSIWSSEEINLILHVSKILETILSKQGITSLIPPGNIDKTVLGQLQKFYELYSRVESRFDQKKRDLGLVDYEDLLILTYQLLRDNDQIRMHLSEQFEYILVDEFQDTNTLQWLIISLLGDLKQYKYFIVGDPKQSIYGFRSADVRVFTNVQKEFTESDDRSSSAGIITLDESFRFKSLLCDFINFTFDKIFKKGGADNWEVEYQPILTKRADSENGSVSIALFDNENIQYDQSEFIATRIIELKHNSKYNYGDIGILLRTRNHLNEVESQLRSNNIPFKTIGGIGFYQQQEIYDVYYLLRFIVNPSDDIALIGILRSPMVNLSDEGIFFISLIKDGSCYWEKLQKCQQIKNFPSDDLHKIEIFNIRASKWIKRKYRITFSELLFEIFDTSYFRAILSADLNGEQLLANLDKIMEVTIEYEKSGSFSITDFIESLKLLINKQIRESEAQTDLEDIGTVKVMTIHQAKGLEFPVVFLPFLEQRLNTSMNKSFYFNEETGFAPQLNEQQGYDFLQQKTYYFFEYLKQHQHNKEIAELKRIFYVGCTRAKDNLILSGSIKNKKSPKGTPLLWLLNALQINPIEAEAKRISVSDMGAIDILYGYTKDDSDFRKTKDHVKSSLEALKVSGETNVDKTDSPIFLRPIVDKAKGEMISATQIMSFLHNPDEYFRRYHLGYFEEDYNRLTFSEFSEDAAIFRGKIIHRYLEKYPEINVDDLFLEFELNDKTLIDEIREDILRIDRNILVSNQLKRILDARENRNEVNITYKLKNDFLTGTLDRIFKNGEDDWEVIDYKTNRINRMEVTSTAQRYKMQMDVYAVLLAATFRKQGRYKINLYFTHPDEFFVHEYKGRDIIAIEDKLGNIIQEMKQFYP